VTAHWGVPDPAAVEGTQEEKNRAFHYAFQALETRIKVLLSLPLEALDRLESRGRSPTPLPASARLMLPVSSSRIFDIGVGPLNSPIFTRIYGS
jgi:hypothetical protein